MPRDEDPPVLPCHPCPHSSACCTWGAPLTEDEATELVTRFGTASIEWDPDDAEWRTTVVDGVCFFLEDNTCSIHGHASYPSVCAGFPWKPDGSEVDICPELLTGKHPDLDPLFDPETKRLRVDATPIGARLSSPCEAGSRCKSDAEPPP